MQVLVTGSNGFIGKNLVSHINQKKNFKVLHFGRGDSLSEVLPQADFIFHLAGENRPEDPVDFEKNMENFI